MTAQTGLSLSWSQTRRQVFSWRGSFITDRSKAVLWLLYVRFLLVFWLLSFFLGQPCGHLLGKSWPLGFPLMLFYFMLSWLFVGIWGRMWNLIASSTFQNLYFWYTCHIKDTRGDSIEYPQHIYGELTKIVLQLSSNSHLICFFISGNVSIFFRVGQYAFSFFLYRKSMKIIQNTQKIKEKFSDA